MTQREKHLLFLILNFSICRYVLSVNRKDKEEIKDRKKYINKILANYSGNTITETKKITSNIFAKYESDYNKKYLFDDLVNNVNLIRVSKNKEKQLLRILLEPYCQKYIFTNVKDSRISYRKADFHILISKIIAHYLTCDGGEYTVRGLNDECPKGTWKIHDWTQQYIMDLLDHYIGLPLNVKLCYEQLDKYARKLFNTLWYYMPVCESLVNEDDD